MSHRFFVHPAITTEWVQLGGPEAHHLIHVMRARVGERVVLFDGSGGEYVAVVDDVSRKRVGLRVEARHEVDRELSVPLILAVALPRGDRQEWLVEKAVELGVCRLVPWQTQRSVARPKDASLERLRRTVIEASKQCGRNRLMEIEPPCQMNDYLARSVNMASLLADPDGDHGSIPARALESLRRGSLVHGVRIGIGPEGGFTEAEVQQALAADWQPIRLGPRILRTETAALALAAHVALGLASEAP